METLTPSVSASPRVAAQSTTIAEWLRTSFGIDLSSVKYFIKTNKVRVNEVLVKNINYGVNDKDVVSINKQNYLVQRRKDKK